MLLFAFTFTVLSLAAAGLAAGVIGGREPPAGTCLGASRAAGLPRCEACPSRRSGEQEAASDRRL